MRYKLSKDIFYISYGSDTIVANASTNLIGVYNYDLYKVLDFFREPKSIDEIVAESGYDSNKAQSVIKNLIEQGILVPISLDNWY